MSKTKITTLDAFRKKLLETGSYNTANFNRGIKRANLGALTTLSFSLNVAKVFPISAILCPLGLLTVDRWTRVCFSTLQTAERLGMNVELEGWSERAKYKGPVVYVANHMSTYETIFLPPVLITYGPLKVVAKASLAHLPFLEKAAADMGLVPIGRKNPKEDLVSILKTGVEKINEGYSFLIFPQGTRQEVFSHRKFSSIGAKLAERAGCPLVPIAIDTRCQPCRKEGLLKKVFHDFGPVDTSKDIRCACGPVIPCTKSREMHEKSFDWIASKLETWGIEVDK